MQSEAQAALRRVWLKQERARYERLGQTRPEEVEVWRRLGQICWELGEVEPAALAFERALVLQPDHVETLADQILAYVTLGRCEQALVTAERALALAPRHGDILLLRADALRLAAGRSDEALAAYERALDLPDLSASQRLHALNHQATLWMQRQAHEQALAVVDAALRLAPADPQLTLRRATVLLGLRRYAEALRDLERLAAIPELELEVLASQAWALAALERFDEADLILGELYRRYDWREIGARFAGRPASRIPTDDTLPKRCTARGLRLLDFFNALAACDWRDCETVLARLDGWVADLRDYGRVLGMEQHYLLRLPVPPEFLLATARARAVVQEKFVAPLRRSLALTPPASAPDGRLRVGYVSGDFRDHATAHLARKLFRVHDRRRFEIVGYTLRSGDDSAYWRDISQACDRMVDLSSLSNREAAGRIAADGVHILVDMHGYTRFARPEIFALRPAPVQVGFLGYPGTLGGDSIPYFIADEVVLPEALRPCFSEQPVYLPDCYQVNDNEQPIADTGLTRAAQGLPEDAFVYASFNASYKIEPATFVSWLNILRQVPGSVLWLLADNQRMVYHLRRAASARGVAPERLIFAARLPKPEHLERQRLADLFLDTFVVNAHTTASDALWAGLPVLTLCGRAFHARVCASLLRAVGLPELIAYSVSDYETLAVALAGNRARLADLRQRLRADRLTNPLFDTERYARHLERAYELLWREHQTGQPPRPLWVAPLG